MGILNWLKRIFNGHSNPMLPSPSTSSELSTNSTAASASSSATPNHTETTPASSDSVEKLREELAKAHNTIGQLKLAYADLLNDRKAFQKRLQKEKERAINEGVCKVTRDLLDISDELDRALTALQNDEGPLAVGVRLVHASMCKRLTKLGVQRMELEGKPFDPTSAEAIEIVPVQNQAHDGMVIQIFRPGFTLNGSILREARVSVGKWSSPTPPPESQADKTSNFSVQDENNSPDSSTISSTNSFDEPPIASQANSDTDTPSAETKPGSMADSTTTSTNSPTTLSVVSAAPSNSPASPTDTPSASATLLTQSSSSEKKDSTDSTAKDDNPTTKIDDTRATQSASKEIPSPSSQAT